MWTHALLHTHLHTPSHLSLKLCALTLGSLAKNSIKTDGTSAKSVEHLVPVYTHTRTHTHTITYNTQSSNIHVSQNRLLSYKLPFCTWQETWNVIYKMWVENCCTSRYTTHTFTCTGTLTSTRHAHTSHKLIHFHVWSLSVCLSVSLSISLCLGLSHSLRPTASLSLFLSLFHSTLYPFLSTTPTLPLLQSPPPPSNLWHAGTWCGPAWSAWRGQTHERGSPSCQGSGGWGYCRQGRAGSAAAPPQAAGRCRRHSVARHVSWSGSPGTAQVRIVAVSQWLLHTCRREYVHRL